MQVTESARDELSSELMNWLVQLSAALNADGNLCKRVALWLPDLSDSRDGLFISLPQDRVPAAEMSRTREEAARLNRITLSGLSSAGNSKAGDAIHIVVPMSVADPDRSGWIEVEAHVTSQDLAQGLIEKITQALGWLLFRLELAKGASLKGAGDRSFRALEAIVSLSSSEQFSDAVRALVSDLANRFDCDRVSIGLAKRNTVKLEAISHTSRFTRSSTVSRRLRGAMEEAIDQSAVVAWPANISGSFINDQQSELVENDATKAVLTVPLFDGSAIQGAITFERANGNNFTSDDVLTIEALCNILTPLILDKRKADRWLISHALVASANMLKRLLGKRHFAAKTVVLVMVLISAALVLIQWPHYITSEATIVGREIRTLSPAFDGVILRADAKQGEQVTEGQFLFSLDDREFELERSRLVAQRRQAELELDRALSSRDRTESALINARLEQIDSQLLLIRDQIDRSIVRAPFDALIVSGDLTRSIGSAVNRGEPLLTLAPLTEYQVKLDVEEDDLRSVYEGQRGTLTLSALPNRRFTLEVAELVPVARYEGGSTLFTVEANLLDEEAPLLHGMTGSSRLFVEDLPLYLLWGRPLYNEARLWAWRTFAL